MKKSILTRLIAALLLTVNTNAQIPNEFTGVYSQKFNPQSPGFKFGHLQSAESFSTFDKDWMVLMPKDMGMSLPQMPQRPMEIIDSVMEMFFDGFTDMDTVIEDGNSKISMHSSLKRYSSCNKEQEAMDSLMQWSDIWQMQDWDSLVAENLNRIRNMKYFSDSAFEQLSAIVPSLSDRSIQKGVYTITTDEDGNTQTTSSYSFTDKDGNVYTDEDINLIITPNSIEEVSALTGGTLSLISFDNSQIQKTQNGYRITPDIGFPFDLNVNQNGETEYIRAGMFPFLLTKKQNITKSETEDTDVKLSIYPNPASDMLTLYSKDTIKSAELINLCGQKVFDTQMNGNYTRIYTGNFAKGTYVLNVYTDKGRITKSVVLK